MDRSRNRFQRRDENLFLKAPHSSCSSSEQQAGRGTDGADRSIYLPGAELRNSDPCFLSPSLPFTSLRSIFSSSFLSLDDHFIGCCTAASKKLLTWLITSSGEPAGQKTKLNSEETEGVAGQLALTYFLWSSHLQLQANRWGCREPLAILSPPLASTSPHTSFCSTYTFLCFLLQREYKDVGVFCIYFKQKHPRCVSI